MEKINPTLILIILTHLVLLSHGQILQHERSRFCKILRINCNRRVAEGIPFRYGQHYQYQNENPMRRNDLKHKISGAKERPVTEKAYESLQKLKTWFNDWNSHLSLNAEQVKDLKLKLQALERTYLEIRNMTQYITTDENKCKTGKQKCRKPAKLDKRITGQSNSVENEDSGDSPPDPDRGRQEFLGMVQSAMNFFATAPFLLANMSMAFVTVGLGIFGLAGGLRLGEIHQEQLNALSALAGVPIELVTPLRDQDPDGPQTEIIGGDSGDPGRIGLSLFNPNYESPEFVRKTWEDIQQFIHEMKTKSLLENSFLIIPLVLFWTALLVFSSIFGFSGITLLLIMIIAPVIYFAKLERFGSNGFGGQKYVSMHFKRNSLEHNINFATEGLERAIRNYENLVKI